MTLVDIKGLKVSFAQHGGVVEAVRGVSLHVNEGESLGIVGESGSGKSVTCMALMRLLAPTAKVSADSLILDDVNVLSADTRALSALRGRSAAMIFQDPATAFDPVFTIGHQIAETIRTHRRASKREARAEAEDLLRRVEILNAKDVLNYYPHQLSGGMLQRAMIAMALSCRPKLLIADEPTTALDVTIQAQILDLMRDLKQRVGAAIMLITHDLGVVAEVADQVVVMYAGRKVEEAPVRELFANPRHPYTQGLLGAVPKLGSSLVGEADRLAEIPGLVPSLKRKIEGCVFAGRCPKVTDLCRQVAPGLEVKAQGHIAACHYAAKEAVAA